MARKTPAKKPASKSKTPASKTTKRQEERTKTPRSDARRSTRHTDKKSPEDERKQAAVQWTGFEDSGSGECSDSNVDEEEQESCDPFQFRRKKNDLVLPIDAMENVNISFTRAKGIQKRETGHLKELYVESSEDELVTVQDYFSTKSDLYPDRQLETLKEIEFFSLSRENYDAGWSVDESALSRSSALQYHGITVYLEQESSVKKWICLVAECGKNKNNPDSWFSLGTTYKTSSSTRHLVNLHQVISNKTKVEEGNKVILDAEYDYLSHSQLYRKNLNRFCRLSWAFMIVSMNLPFVMVQKKPVRMIFELVCHGGMTSDFSVPALMHLISEMFIHVHDKIVYEIASVCNGSLVPRLSLNVDVWEVKSLRSKYVGVRVYYLLNFELVSRLLAVRRFNPSSLVRQSMRLGNIIQAWVDSVLDDFNIKIADIFGSTTDGGPDIKRWAMVLMPGKKWEHCPPHAIARGVLSAVGFESPNARTSFESTLLVKAVKNVITSIKQTTRLGEKFEELNKKQGIKVALQTFRAHRFMGVYTMLDKFTICFQSVRAFFQALGEQFPVNGKEQELHKMTSILHPVAMLTQEMQGSKRPMGWYYVLKMIRMRSVGGDLHIDSPLKRYDDGKPYANPLEGHLLQLRKRLIEEIDKRFFLRYTQLKDLSFDVMLLLHPAYKNVSYTPMVRAVLSDQAKRQSFPVPTDNEVNQLVLKIRTTIIGKLKDIILLALEKEGKNPNEQGAAESTVNNNWLMEFAECAQGNAAADIVSLTRIANGAIEKYLNSKCSFATPDELMNPLSSYWKVRGTEHEIILLAVPAVFSLPSSACPLELDFSEASPMVNAQRSNLKPVTVEEARLIYANAELVDIPHVKEVSNSNRILLMPTSPNVALELYCEDAAVEMDEDSVFFVDRIIFDSSENE